jgi:ABC-2 type transport system ATP-binding protein
LSSSAISIEARNLTRYFGRSAAVRDLTFTIRQGEVVGFLGPNGAGKTTTLRILTGLLAADCGEAWVAGIPVACDPGAVRVKIGYMPENNPLPEDMRVTEYLRFRARLKGLSGRRLRQRIDAVLDICDLHRKTRRKVIGALSKGFRQRVGIADAILAEPEITILDEPTIGLDPHQVILIRELINQLRGHTTVIFSSHILAEVEVLCDRVLILNQGRLVATGTPAQLRKEFLPGSGYLLEIAATRAAVEARLDTLAEGLRIVAWDAIEPAGYARVRVDATAGNGDLSEQLLSALHGAPGIRLRALRRTQPSLEDIFLAATRRSWELGTEEVR